MKLTDVRARRELAMDVAALESDGVLALMEDNERLKRELADNERLKRELAECRASHHRLGVDYEKLQYAYAALQPPHAAGGGNG